MSESLQSQTAGQRQPSWPESKSAETRDYSLIGPTVVIKGEVTAEEDLMIKGRVEGFIDHSQTVSVHAQGTVAAEIMAREVLVEGTVDGNVYGTERVQIAETGSVSGNVYAPRVGVTEGASFKGAIDMDSGAGAIERRFREKSGMDGGAKAPAVQAAKPKKSADVKAAPGVPATAGPDSKDTKGEAHASQAEEKGSSDDAAGSKS